MLDEPDTTNTDPTAESDQTPQPRRRRRAASRPAGPPLAEQATETAAEKPEKATTTSTGTATVPDTTDAEPQKRPRRTRKKAAAPAAADTTVTEAPAAETQPESAPADEASAEQKPARRRTRKKAEAAPAETPAAEIPSAVDTDEKAAAEQDKNAEQAKNAESTDETKAPARRRRGRPAVADPFAVPEIDPAAARTTPSVEGDAAAADSDEETDDGEQKAEAEKSGSGRRRRGRGRGARSGEDESEKSQDTKSQDEKVEDSSDEENSQDQKNSKDQKNDGESKDEDDTDDSSDSDKSDNDNSDNDDSDDDEAGGRRRRRRRGGRRRRRSGDDSESGDDSDDGRSDDKPDGKSNDKPDDKPEGGDNDSRSDDSDDDGEDGGRRRRRRRSRSRRGGGDEPDDGGRKRANDAVTGIDGSTRMEAKRQRRKEGREAGRRRAPILSEAEFLARRESVKRTMIIRQGEGISQLAVLEDNNLVEHYVDNSSARSLIGNVYLGKVQNVLPSMEAAFIDIGEGRNAVLYAGELDWDAFGGPGHSKKIESVLKSGQTVLVQATKDPVGAKGARLTNHISLPGRYIVYSPGGHLSGISRKLPDTERKRLKAVLSEHLDENASVIVRTAAEGASEEELVRDVNRLTLQWEAIEKQTKGSAPQQLYSEPDLTVRIVRDLFTEDFAELIIQGNGQDDDAYDNVMGYVQHVAPHLADRIRRWEDNSNGKDAFGAHRIDEQIAKALERKVHLPSGGSLIIDRTEAMTVIDVNTGKFTGTGGNLEATVTSNNLEAAEEIVRQLRLRDLGGIIVIDFIDMVLPSNRELLLRRVVECLGRDRTRHQVAEVTSLGLVQMTRKRIGTGLGEAFTTDCEHCQGRGYVTHDEPLEIEAADDNDRRGRNARGGSSNRGGRRSRGGNGGQGNEVTPPPRQPLPKVMPPIPDQFRKDNVEDQAGNDTADQTSESPVSETPVTGSVVAEAVTEAPSSEPTTAAPEKSRGRSARGKGVRRATRGTTVAAASTDQQETTVTEDRGTDQPVELPRQDADPVAVEPLKGAAGEATILSAADVPSGADDRTVRVDLSDQGQTLAAAPSSTAPESVVVTAEEAARAGSPATPEAVPNPEGK